MDRLAAKLKESAELQLDKEAEYCGSLFGYDDCCGCGDKDLDIIIRKSFNSSKTNTGKEKKVLL